MRPNMTRPILLAKLLLPVFAVGAAISAAGSPPRYAAQTGDILRYTIVQKDAPAQPVVSWDLFCTGTNATSGVRWVYRLRIDPFEGAEFPMPPRVYEEGGRFDCLPDGTLHNLQGALQMADPGIIFPALPPQMTTTSSWSVLRRKVVHHGVLQSLPTPDNPELRFVLAHTRQPSPLLRAAVKVEYRFDPLRGRVLGGRMEVVDTRQPDKRTVHILALDSTFRIADGEFAILMKDEKTVFDTLDSYELIMARVESGGGRETAAASEAKRILDSGVAQTRTVFLRNELQKRINAHDGRVSRVRRSLP